MNHDPLSQRALLDMWPAYLLNLAADTERFRNSKMQFEALGIDFERTNAIAGKNLTEQEIASVYDAKANRRLARNPLTPSEIGCYLSHAEAWKKIAKGNDAGGFIFEDDFLASDDLAILMKQLSEDLDDWDMVKLFSLNPNPKCISQRLLESGHTLAMPYRVPNCTIGYGLRKSAAQKLLHHSIPFFRPVDEDQKFFWETGLRVALVLPPPVTIGNQETATTTIGEERRAAKPTRLTGRIFRGGRSLIYRIRYTALLHYHRVIR